MLYETPAYMTQKVSLGCLWFICICKSIVCICLHLKERCMCRKPSRTHFILCLQCLFFLLKKRSFHANPLCMIIHYLENVVWSGGGWGRAKKTIMAKNWRIFTYNVLSPNLKRRKKSKGALRIQTPLLHTKQTVTLC